MGPLPAAFPKSTVPEPRDAPSLRWGILAPGGIAAQFAATLHHNTSQRVLAVASRSPERAVAFAATHGVERVHSSYEELVADPDIDVVYVAAPQSEHCRLALLAIGADKNVLVEKPFTTTAAEAVEVVAAARSRGVFAMEAMWTRYLPQSSIITRLVSDGVLGDIRLVSADHGQLMDPGGRLYQPELGGGALLDLGIYPVSFAFGLLGSPSRVSTSGTLTATGVDAQSVLTMDYAGAAQALLSTTMLARTPMTAVVAGSRATLEVQPPFFLPTGLTLSDTAFLGTSMSWQDESGITRHEGLCYQAAAVARYITEGRTESPLGGLAETVEIMTVLDTARHDIGAWFPGEQPAH